MISKVQNQSQVKKTSLHLIFWLYIDVIYFAEIEFTYILTVNQWIIRLFYLQRSSFAHSLLMPHSYI